MFKIGGAFETWFWGTASEAWRDKSAKIGDLSPNRPARAAVLLVIAACCQRYVSIGLQSTITDMYSSTSQLSASKCSVKGGIFRSRDETPITLKGTQQTRSIVNLFNP